MRKPVIITIIVIALALAIGITVLAATSSSAGTSDDPLVSRSYVNGQYSADLIKDASAPIDATLSPIAKTAIAEASKAAPADSTARVSVLKGGALTLGEGASLTMTSGSAAIEITAGTVSDVTAGTAAENGALAENHRYIVCTGGKASVTVDKKSAFITSGSVTVTAGAAAPVKFADVKPADWFYEYVVSAVEMGLVNGTTATTYTPNGTLTLAEAIKLAACMHQQYTDGKVTLASDPDIWYMSYVKYAVSENIIDGSYAGKTTKEYASPITREEFAHIFHGALPDSEYTQINSVKDNAIPDVKLSSTYGDEIYDFYRSGILTGDASHKFNPATTILRSEVAAIVARMMDSSLRQSVTLKYKL